jgi:hypothetical protein
MINLFKLILISLVVTSVTPVVVNASPITFECKYVNYSDESGNHHFSEPLTTKYVWDKAKKNAYTIGNLGTEEVSVVEGKGITTFIEVTLSGNVMTTTINNKGKSVHSRHSEGIPSQSYGTCIQK